jgi:hypothetical protein
MAGISCPYLTPMLDSTLVAASKAPFERKLDLQRGFLACTAMRHHAGPFDNLRHKAFAEYQMRVS